MVKKLKSASSIALRLTLVITILFPSVSNIDQSQASIERYSTKKASSLWVVVNKRHPLNPIDYAPKKLVAPHFGAALNSNPYGRLLRQDAAAAAIELAKAMNKAGKGVLVIQSAYRSYSEQLAVHNREISRFGFKMGESLAARAGYSEHQTGLAMDVSARGQGCQVRFCFGGTTAGTWLRQKAYKYGWIIRYPQNATKYTGYHYEPWHLRFVGVKLATAMHRRGEVVLEKYFGLPAAPGYK